MKSITSFHDVAIQHVAYFPSEAGTGWSSCRSLRWLEAKDLVVNDEQGSRADCVRADPASVKNLPPETYTKPFPAPSLAIFSRHSVSMASGAG